MNVQHEDMPPTAMTNVSTRGWAEAGMGARCTMTATRPRTADLMHFTCLQPAVGGGVVWRAANPANCFFIFSPGEVVVWRLVLQMSCHAPRGPASLADQHQLPRRAAGLLPKCN